MRDWATNLSLASACYDMCGLWCLGVALVFDKKKGPLLLELNARPGLSIQIANAQGLIPRLRQIENIEGISNYTVVQRVHYAQSMASS